MGGCLSSSKQQGASYEAGSATRSIPVLQQGQQQQHRGHSAGGTVTCVLPQPGSPGNNLASPAKVPAVTRTRSVASISSQGKEQRQDTLHAVAVSRVGSTSIYRRSSNDRASMQSEQSMILGTPKNSAHRLSPEQLVARANSRASTQHKKNSVGADLHSIMDDQGMLNPLVARQMSVLSHYSVRSESGSVLITPVQKSKPEFQLLKLIGRGGFGNVYLGDWHGHESERVAIKIIQGFNHADQPDEQEWEARKERMAQMEAVLMSAIAHDNIVRTLKVIAYQGEQVDAELAAVERQLLKSHLPPGNNDQDDGPPIFEWHILMEYCDKGALSRALSSFMLHMPLDAHTVAWDAWASLEILKEVTRSLIFLHEHRILHGDLKAANVLLTSSSLDRRRYHAKVSDFGLSRVLANNKNHIKTQTFGTVTHVPPELLAKGTLSPKADVYAMGILLWEIYTGEKVFKQLSDSEVILAVVTKKARPTFPSDVPPRYKFLAERCWSEMMELRPSLQVVMTELDNLQRTLCPEGSASAPLTCKVFPTRAKALGEMLAKQKHAAAAKEAVAREAAAAPPPSSGSLMGGGSPGLGLGGVSRTDSGAPSSPARGPPAAARVASALAAVGGSPSPRSPLSVGTTMKSGSNAISVESSPGSYNVCSQPGMRPFPGASHASAVQLGPRLNASAGGASPANQHQAHAPMGKHRSSGGRTLSLLAPQHADSPARVNPELSVQRPAEPRQSRDNVPPVVAVQMPYQGSLSALGPSSGLSPSALGVFGIGGDINGLVSKGDPPGYIQAMPMQPSPPQSPLLSASMILPSTRSPRSPMTSRSASMVMGDGPYVSGGVSKAVPPVSPLSMTSAGKSVSFHNT